jgi:uncharacterized repeat protein (TIGR03803 family)
MGDFIRSALRHVQPLAFALLPAFVLPFAPAHAESYSVLYAFQGGTDGEYPAASVVFDKAGNLYGTTYSGGGHECGQGSSCGTIFKITPTGKETVLYAFTGGSDGAFPDAPLTPGRKGAFFGTTFGGGACCGTAFELKANGTFKALYEFVSGNGGADPKGPVLKKGKSYVGTAFAGGSSSCLDGCGVIYGLARGGAETVIFSFQEKTTGEYPLGSLISDGSGNLYGTTQAGGTGANCGSQGCEGTVFELAPNGTETVLHSFAFADGNEPEAGVIRDSAGNLYGTAVIGGGSSFNCGDFGCGTVFKLAPDGTFTVLHDFAGGDGGTPLGGLLLDSKGNLYGTASIGGRSGMG